MGDKKEAFWKVIVLKTRRAFGKMRRDSKVSWAVGAWLRSRPGPESTSRAWSATRTRGAPPRRQGPERGSDRLRVPSLVEYRAGERPVGPRALHTRPGKELVAGRIPARVPGVEEEPLSFWSQTKPVRSTPVLAETVTMLPRPRKPSSRGASSRMLSLFSALSPSKMPPSYLPSDTRKVTVPATRLARRQISGFRFDGRR